MSTVWSLYMIRCADQSLYTGITTDLDRRFAAHQSQGPKCAKYLRGKAPLKLVFTTVVGTKSEASRLELKVKKCSKRVKEQLVSGEITITQLPLTQLPQQSTPTPIPPI
jgi:putative endonuclease